MKRDAGRAAGALRLLRRAAAVLAALAVLALAGAAYLVELRGGSGVPTWAQLYAALGVPLDAPDAALLADGTSVTALDVGQGDAVLIAQDGQFCLIDTGTADSADVLVRELRQAGVEQLQMLVLTHPHADHTGGARAVLESFTVEQLLLPPWEPDSGGEPTAAWPDGLLEQAAQQGVEVVEPEDGAQYTLGSGTLTVLQGGWPEDGAEPAFAGDANNASLCTMFTAGTFRYLSTGDAEAEAEQALTDRYGSALRAVLYKAGHHGSYTSSNEALLDAVRPQAAIISCGADNDYGHPHAAALRRLQQAGAEIYRTDTMGTVTFTWQNGVLLADVAEEPAAAA